MLDLNNIQLDFRNKYVFFAGKNHIVYREGRSLRMDNCNGDNLHTVECPGDWRFYSFCEYPDGILLIFGNKDLVFFSTDNTPPLQYRLDENRIGKCVTDLFPGENPNTVVFGTKKHNSLQVLSFNFKTKRRLKQTASFANNKINALYCDNQKYYLLIDQSLLYVFNQDFETILQRFETGKIGRGVFSHQDQILYSCYNSIKMCKNTDVQNIKLPPVRFTSIEHSLENLLFCTSNNFNNICCLNLDDKKIIWDMNGTHKIEQSLSGSGIYKGSKHELLFLRLDEYLVIIDLNSGQSIYRTKITYFYDMKRTGNHIILHTYDGNSYLIEGV